MAGILTREYPAQSFPAQPLHYISVHIKFDMVYKCQMLLKVLALLQLNIR